MNALRKIGEYQEALRVYKDAIAYIEGNPTSKVCEISNVVRQR
jgi:hypothetical protein